VEDDSTSATQAALRVREQLERMRLLSAIELIVAAQAVDLALVGHGGALGAGTGVAFEAVRECVDMLEEDRPLGPDVERLNAQLLEGGQLLQRVQATSGSLPR
jgi:histidine ammonia-lyase